MNPAVLAGSAAAALVTLGVVFPGQSLVSELVRRQQPDEVTLAYARALVQAAPHEPEWQLLLAEQEAALGQFAAVQARIKRLAPLSDPAQRARLDWLRFLLADGLLRNTRIDDPELELRRSAARAAADALGPLPLPAVQVRRVADRCGQWRSFAPAAIHYRRLAVGDPAQRVRWLDEGGSGALKAGDYHTAAELYFEAQAAAERSEVNHYFHAAVEALRAGNLPVEALAAARQHLDRVTLDDRTLLRLLDLAREANDSRAAEEFARRLLEPRLPSASRWSFFINEAFAADESSAELRAFDQTVFEKTWQVFVGGGDVEQAYRIAKRATEAQPENAVWRERAARTAEWTNRPAEAVQHWYALAKRTNRASAWEAVMRIAPGVQRTDLVAEGWRHRAEEGTLDHADWLRLIDAFEEAGAPEKALTLLERAERRKHDPFLLWQQAALLDNAGRVRESTAVYQKLAAADGADAETLVRYAGLLVAQGRVREAAAVLRRHRNRAASDAVDYWQVLADLAGRLGDDEAAIDAYGRLIQTKDPRDSHYRNLIQLLNDRDPEAAAEVAFAGASRLHDPDLAALGLRTLIDRNRIPAARRLLDGLDPWLADHGEASSDFLAARAAFWLRSAKCAPAARDYRQALGLTPDNPDLAIDYLWAMVECGDRETLALWLPRVQIKAASEEHFADLIPAMSQAVEQPRLALAYMAPEAPRHRDDPAWLLEYADVLEQAEQAAAAQAARRHAQEVLRARMKSPATSEPEMLAWATIALQLHPGDPAAAAFRELLRQDRARPVQDPNTRALVIAWTSSLSGSDALRAWLWRRSAPWVVGQNAAEMDLALQDEDREAMSRLLDRAGDLHAGQRAHAQQELGRMAEARTTLFQEASRDSRANEVHDSFREAANDASGEAFAQTRLLTQGFLEATETSAGWRSPTGAEWGVEPWWLQRRQRGSDGAPLVNIPSEEREAGVVLRHGASPDSAVTLRYARRHAVTEVDNWAVTWDGVPFKGLRTGAEAIKNGRAEENSALVIAGMRDQWTLHALYALDERQYLQARYWRSRYFLQSPNAPLGEATGFSSEWGYNLRAGWPDVLFRVTGTRLDFRTDSGANTLTTVVLPPGADAAAEFMPSDYEELALHGAIGSATRDAMGQGWRAFAEGGVSSNSKTGFGYSIVLGVGGPLAGRDRVALTWERVRGGLDTTGETEWSLALNYRLLTGAP